MASTPRTKLSVELKIEAGMLIRLSATASRLSVLLTLWGCAVIAAQAALVEVSPQIIRVGATRDIKTIAAAAQLVRDNGIVEVDAGDYVADVAVWDKHGLTVRAVGGRARLIANEASAEGKAIWVVRSNKMQVVGFDFSGATVPSRNGAGIRFEKGWLVVRDCSFVGNENGILTGNDGESQLDIEDSEFAHNGFGDGQSHNLYVGQIARLSVMGSYFHHAKVGHLLKTRAAMNVIRYNRLTDEINGEASYELEFANGGIAYVIGNILEQGAGTNNPHLISYGTEGYKWPRNELYLVHNTLVDNRPNGGIFLRTKAGVDFVKAENNLLVGNANDDLGEPTRNFRATPADMVDHQRSDYRLKPTSPLHGKALLSTPDRVFDFFPRRQYALPRGSIALQKKPNDPGALQN